MSNDSVTNAEKPNAGRIYDYLLGGHHNFEVDRIAAERLKSLTSFVTKAPRLQRWCLKDLADELSDRRGFDLIIDFASGLPTQDHIHEAARPGTTVIYSDADPVVVEYAHEILKDTPNVYFFQNDARHPEELLNRPEVRTLIGTRSKIALVYWGVSAFLSDDDLIHAARFLHDWAGPDSCWAFNAQLADVGVDTAVVKTALGLYQQMGSPLYLRSLDDYRRLTKPWRPDGQDFISFSDWHSLDEAEMSEQDRQAFGPAGGGYGSYLMK